MVVVASLLWCLQTWQAMQGRIAVPGHVVRLNTGGSHPEIVFKALDGRVFSYPQGGLIFGYRAGDRVTVLYNPADPRQATIDALGALWGFPALALAVGLGLLVAAWCVPHDLSH